jgi:hypothetical protein
MNAGEPYHILLTSTANLAVVRLLLAPLRAGVGGGRATATRHIIVTSVTCASVLPCPRPDTTMVLLASCVTACVATGLVLLHGHSTVAVPGDNQVPVAIDEVDGMLYVTEPVNTFRMERHIQLWVADLQGQRDVEKLDLLLASKTIREMSLLMSSLKALAVQGTSSSLPWIDPTAAPSSSPLTDKDNQALQKEHSG